MGRDGIGLANYVTCSRSAPAAWALTPIPLQKKSYLPFGHTGILRALASFDTHRNGGLAEVGFSTSRKISLDEPVTANDLAEVWRLQARFPDDGKPVGQRSQIVEIPVDGW